jgi:hypothetical protein
MITGWRGRGAARRVHRYPGGQQGHGVRVPEVAQPDGAAAAKCFAQRLSESANVWEKRADCRCLSTWSANTGASSRTRWRAIAPRAFRWALDTVTVAASRSITRGLPPTSAETRSHSWPEVLVGARRTHPSTGDLITMTSPADVAAIINRARLRLTATVAELTTKTRPTPRG